MQAVSLERYISTLDTAYIFLLTSFNLVAGIFFSRINSIFPEIKIAAPDAIVIILAELFAYQVVLQAGAMIRNSHKTRWEAWKTLFINFSMIFLVLPIALGIWNLPLSLPNSLIFLAPLIASFLLFASFIVSTLVAAWIADKSYRWFESTVRRTVPEIAPFYAPLLKGGLPKILLSSITYSALVAVVFHLSLLLPPPYGLFLLTSFVAGMFLVVFSRMIVRRLRVHIR